MKVFIHDYAGHPFAVDLSRELAHRGHSVTHAYAGGLLTPRGALTPKSDDPPGFRVIEIPMDATYRRYKYRFVRRRSMEVTYGESLSAAVRRLQPDVVLSGNTPTEPQYRLLCECERLSISFVSWIQDFYSVAVTKLARMKLPVLGEAVGWWYRHLERQTLARSAAVVVITEDFLPILERFGIDAGKALIVPNWAPIKELPVSPRSNPWSVERGLEGRFCFLYAGTLAMKHNPELLLRLAERFSDCPDVRVVVVSEGPGAEWLRANAEERNLENILLVPFEDFGRMPEVIATADVLVAVLARDAGTFSVPSKVLTYLCGARGLLAAIPHGNLAERTIREAGAGVCVEPEDADLFISGAWHLYTDKQARLDYGLRGRAWAEAHFDIRKISDQFETCLASHL